MSQEECLTSTSVGRLPYAWADSNMRARVDTRLFVRAQPDSQRATWQNCMTPAGPYCSSVFSSSITSCQGRWHDYPHSQFAPFQSPYTPSVTVSASSDLRRNLAYAFTCAVDVPLERLATQGRKLALAPTQRWAQCAKPPSLATRGGRCGLWGLGAAGGAGFGGPGLAGQKLAWPPPTSMGPLAPLFESAPRDALSWRTSGPRILFTSRSED